MVKMETCRITWRLKGKVVNQVLGEATINSMLAAASNDVDFYLEDQVYDQIECETHHAKVWVRVWALYL